MIYLELLTMQTRNIHLKFFFYDIRHDFLDAYDITILGTMTDQLTKEFHLSPTMLSVVMTSLPIGALFGAILGVHLHINSGVSVYYLSHYLSL